MLCHGPLLRYCIYIFYKLGSFLSDHFALYPTMFVANFCLRILVYMLALMCPNPTYTRIYMLLRLNLSKNTHG